MTKNVFRIQPASGIPIYVQLIEQVKHAVESCLLMPGDQLPGIRTLSQQLVISPNTVVKAYTELDREGVIALRHGAGAFVADRGAAPDRAEDVPLARGLVKDLVKKLRRHGWSDDEIRRFVDAELTFEEVRR
ncbi:MAG TPA: GntR family transcriptional regulator [Candidatus Acidoferrales bacterium]|nr:GntR family transcriptional regulator [Candidatus Acidoferrales bacterium]